MYPRDVKAAGIRHRSVADQVVLWSVKHLEVSGKEEVMGLVVIQHLLRTLGRAEPIPTAHKKGANAHNSNSVLDHLDTLRPSTS